MTAHYEEVLADILARDARDFGREVAPLRPARDALLLDTSKLKPEEAIAEALRLAEERLARAEFVKTPLTVGLNSLFSAILMVGSKWIAR